MAFVSVTRLRIRSIRFLPAFFLHTLRARRQVQAAPGFREGSLLPDRRWTFWTLTLWDSQAAMHSYMTSGAHRVAMPRLLRWCDEASVAHWETDDPRLPSWEEANRRMRAEGRPSKVLRPSPAHASLSYTEPRSFAGSRIDPQA